MSLWFPWKPWTRTTTWTPISGYYFSVSFKVDEQDSIILASVISLDFLTNCTNYASRSETKTSSKTIVSKLGKLSYDILNKSGKLVS